MPAAQTTFTDGLSKPTEDEMLFVPPLDLPIAISLTEMLLEITNFTANDVFQGLISN